jgi:NADPH:quinone reductase-like Zn-dependent oxidoreductase
MRVIPLSDAVQPPSLLEADAPRPLPHRGELLIRVHAAGVTLTELLKAGPATMHDEGVSGRAGR